MVEIKGIDVSHYQGSIDFNKVKDAGYRFVIAKCTEGSEDGSAIADSAYRQNVSRAKAAGLAVHAYHFFRAVSESDAAAEAKWFLKNLTGDENYLFCDVEARSLNGNRDKLTSFVNEFFYTLEKAGHNKLGIYSGKNFFETRLVENNLRPGLLTWIARYNSVLGRDADIWQHTSSASVPGVIGRCDANIAYTDLIIGGKAGKQSSKPKLTSKPAPKPKGRGYLKKGDRGGKVKELQQLLIRSGYSCGRSGADGIFGAGTEQAVRVFQRAAKIAMDGLAGSQTIDKLKSYRKPQKPSGKSVVPYPGHLLRRGSRGKDVARIQRAVKVTADGQFGPITERAVIAYQQRHGLVADGIVGKKTWNTLF